MTPPLRTIVCGTGFGRFYADAVTAAPGFELVGILARGGGFSRRHARHLGVPLYTDPAGLPGDVDAACVVVGAGVSGGQGGMLARTLLERGVHVLQEHPVGYGELAGAMRAARGGGVRYRLNPFYRHVRPVRRFLEAAAALRTRTTVRAVEATVALQVLHPLVDVLGAALGGLRPWAFAEPVEFDAELAALAATPQPYRVVQGVVGGVPATLRVQNQMDPLDADNGALLWHRLALATDAGVLTLADTHGPVVWSPRLHAPRDSHHRLRHDGPDTGYLDVASTAVLEGTGAGTLREVFTRLWPDALGRALAGFARDVAGGADALRVGEYDLAASRMWQDLTGRLGPPDLVRSLAPPTVRLADLHTTTGRS
ncbi:Gfo/Idh/MocA family oxidoreductase [Nocardiopsis ansamitocini]|uniref:Thiazolinyl imide reductase n=1 Tax=Nocardiopsis ansamitocini TaxID=1670832 RepID=A0A9W6PAN7_9ACTN|nr:Gfo/Idh/MocA family oxidoreductase [Nocardiopsis ansamitocini]GLU50201.1 hypothetical protein Nans01_45520 [Nocardiopsis ansamitocini]